MKVREAAAQMLHSDNEGVRIVAAKFAEAVVLVHSLRSRTSENIPGMDVSLDRVQTTHPFLKVKLCTIIYKKFVYFLI